jgi:hypothetical protein
MDVVLVALLVAGRGLDNEHLLPTALGVCGHGAGR